MDMRRAGGEMRQQLPNRSSEVREAAPEEVGVSAAQRVSKNRLDKQLLGIVWGHFILSLCGRGGPDGLFRSLSGLFLEVYQAGRGVDRSLMRKQYHPVS